MDQTIELLTSALSLKKVSLALVSIVEQCVGGSLQHMNKHSTVIYVGTSHASHSRLVHYLQAGLSVQDVPLREFHQDMIWLRT